MSDKEARALGAGAMITVPDEKGMDHEFKISPVNMRQLAEIQKEALRVYRREYIQTYAEAAKLMEDGQRVLHEKIEESARWDVRDLPRKLAYDASNLPLTKKVLDKLTTIYGELPEDEDANKVDAKRRALLSLSLDDGTIGADEIHKLAGKWPGRAQIPYDTWWVTACYEGMTTLVWTSVSQNHPMVTKDDVGRWPLTSLAAAAKLVEMLTAPAVGNM